MAIIDPNGDLDIIEWIEAQARKPRENIIAILSQHNPILDDTPSGSLNGFFLWRREPASPRTDDMVQMIEDIANAQ